MRRIQIAISLACLIVLCTACHTADKVAYFKTDTEVAASMAVNSKPVSVQPNDQITIVVNLEQPKFAGLYNLPQAWFRDKSYYDAESKYSVDNDGNIDFPVLGKIHVAGLDRKQIAELIKNKLEESPEGVKNPVVTVEYTNLYYSILGEVQRQGRYKIERDEFTLLDALSRAGDLTILGKRQNVKVLRNHDEKVQVYEIDLTDSKSIYSSPAFYIHQNDVIYVEPNKVRTRQSTANGNNLVSTSFWLSVATIITTLLTYLKM